MSRPARRRALTWLVIGTTADRITATLRFATRREADTQAATWRDQPDRWATVGVRWIGTGPAPTDPDAATELPFPPLMLRTTELVPGDDLWTGPTVTGAGTGGRPRTWPTVEGRPRAIRTVAAVRTLPVPPGPSLAPTHLVAFTDGTVAPTGPQTRWRAADPEPTP